MTKIKLVLFITLSFLFLKTKAQPCNLQASASFSLTNNVASFSNASAGTSSITTYLWKFYDGTAIYGSPVTFTSNAVTPPPYTYTANGTYDVILIIRDSPTCYDSTILGFNVCVFSPSLSITNIVGGSVVTFSPHAEGPFLTQMMWQFGDSCINIATNNSLFTHTYFNGVYTPKLYVDYGFNACFVTSSLSPITVTSNPCYANAAFTYSVGSGGVVQFFKTIPLNNTNVLWDFGDGYTSTASSPTHTYGSAGNFHVSLDSYHPNGVAFFFNCRDTSSSNIFVSGIPCVANANFTMQPTGGTPHEYWIDPAYPYNISSAIWSWGDGSTSTGNSVYANHTYSASGSYDICLTVTATCGTSSSTANYCQSQFLSKGVAGDIVSVTVRQPTKINGLSSNQAESTQLELFPNPTDGILNLKLSKEMNIEGIDIFDPLGKKVYSEIPIDTNGEYTVNLNHLRNGIYFIEIKLQQKIISSKIIIAK